MQQETILAIIQLMAQLSTTSELPDNFRVIADDILKRALEIEQQTITSLHAQIVSKITL